MNSFLKKYVLFNLLYFHDPFQSRSSVWTFCRWVAEVLPRGTSLSGNERGETSAVRRLLAARLMFHYGFRQDEMKYVCTVEPRCTNTHLIPTSLYYGQFFFCLWGKKALTCIFSKFNPLISDTLNVGNRHFFLAQGLLYMRIGWLLTWTLHFPLRAVLNKPQFILKIKKPSADTISMFPTLQHTE